MKPLAELLREHFGDDFPVGAGSAKQDDPLVITAKRDYVSFEYATAQMLMEMACYEYKLERQTIRHVDNREVDELAYAVKPAGESEWTETKRFYFDITAGYHKERTSHSYEGFPSALSTMDEGRKPTSEVLRDELLEFASNTFRNGCVPKSHLTALKSDGSQFVFQIGLLDLLGSQRLDLIRYLLFVEKAVAYAHSFQVGVELGGKVGVVRRLAVFSADLYTYAAGELTLDTKDEGGMDVKILEPTTASPSYEFQKLLDGAFVRKKTPIWQRLMRTGRDESDWRDEWNRLRSELHWLRAAK